MVQRHTLPDAHTPQPQARGLKKLWQSLCMAAMACWMPPAKQLVYARYNKLRQDYLLSTLRHHYHKRPDDPAPLFGLTVLDVGCG
ncbi:MAG: hypothetical protein WAX89_01490, partial [Alphaproteobacteria bacterium]